MQLRSGVNRFAFDQAAAKPPKKPWARRALTGIFLMVAAVTGFVSLTSQKAETQAPPPQPTAVTETAQQSAPGPAIAVQQAVQAPADTTPYLSFHGVGAEQSQRGLTAGEKRLAKLFGADFSTDDIRLHFFTKQPGRAVSDTHDTTDIEVYGRSNMSADYSKDKAYNFGTLMHELAGLWQIRQGDGWLHGTTDGYDYPLGPQFVFDDYGPKQQRAMIEDYALRFLHPDRQSYWLPHVYGSDKTLTDARLIELVESKFPDMQAARLAHANVVDRGLTAGEGALLHGLFGDQIDTSVVHTRQHPEKRGDRVGSVSDARNTDFWGPAESSPDYSREQDAERFGTFVHENTHVWQNQNGGRYTRAATVKVDNIYAYRLDSASVFTDYTDEQQAAIVEDYARYYLHSSHEAVYLPKVYGYGDKMEAKLPLLKKVVEDQFPSAKTYREAYEARNVSRIELPVTIIRGSPTGPG